MQSQKHKSCGAHTPGPCECCCMTRSLFESFSWHVLVHTFTKLYVWKICELVDLFFLLTNFFLFKQKRFLVFVSTILPLQSICSAFLPTFLSNGGNLAFFRQVNWIIYIMKPKSLTTSELTSAGPREEMFHSSEGEPVPQNSQK